MKGFLYILSISVFLNSCQSEKVEQVLVEVPALRESEMYDPSDVKKYILEFGDQHHDIALSYINKAHDIKDKNTDKSIFFLKRAITLEPTEELYKELIQTLSDNKDYVQELKALSVLIDEAYYKKDGNLVMEYVFSPPSIDLLSEFIITGIIVNNDIDYYALSILAEHGIDKQKIKDRLLADKRFELDTADIVYKNIMIQFWTDEEVANYKKSLVNLDALFSSVIDTASTFEINQKNVNRFNYENFNGMNYAEDDDGKIVLTDMFVYYLKEKQDDPDKWLQYNINHRFEPQDSLKALVYAVDTSATACPIEMRNIYHHLVIYGPDGRIISDKIVACQSGEKLETVSFHKDHFEITEYKRSWKKPYDKYDFDNEITKIEPLKETSYSISKTGEIAERVVLP